MRIGVGACTVGKPVRYDGGAKGKHNFLTQLADHMELVPFCPEVGIGLGVPRETIRLVEVDGSTEAKDSASHTKNYTKELEAFATSTSNENQDLAGYVLVKGSPSCGQERMKVYNQDGNLANRDGVGIFARQMKAINPLLPMEEDGRLHDPALRESFVTRVYVYQAWLDLKQSGITAQALIEFYARYKYLIMAHDVNAYKAIGPLLANLKNQDLEKLGEQVISLMLTALTKPARRKGFTNALQHLRGYLKRALSTEEKQAIDDAIEQYRTGIVPLVVPMKLLQYEFKRHPDAYIADQVIMQPYPETLGLRNAI